MTKITTVDEYIAKHESWQAELTQLRRLILETGLTETVKWGAPVYTLNNKNVVGLGAFKAHLGLWFFNGALLADKARCLVNAQEGKTKALRQWRFNHNSTIDEALVIEYVQEALENQRLGREIKPEKTKKAEIELPEELQIALDNDKELATIYAKLSPYKQKEYAVHIGSAKRPATRESRLAKAIPMIRQGIGLNDKYRNC